MKKLYLTSTFILILLLVGCGSDSTVVTVSVEDIYTSVAITLTSQYTPVTPTDTPQPTFTNTPEATPTWTSTVAPTPQPVIINPTSSTSSSSSSDACDSSEFVGDVTIPDGAKMLPGQTFKKTWLLKNNGTCNWTEDYEVIFVSGKDMDGDNTPIDVKVSSGAQVKVSVTFVAPTSEGSYTGYWKMTNEEGASFGASFYVQIAVSDNAATFTPTSTSTGYTRTPTSTNASNATKTPTTVIVATNTPIPATETPTSTSQPTVTTAPTIAPPIAPTETTEVLVTEPPKP